MKLFYHQPDGHGPLSFFVVAENAEDAARAVNAFCDRGGADNYSRGRDTPFEPSDFECAEPGQVVTNGNS